jgi:hypothetical protein
LYQDREQGALRSLKLELEEGVSERGGRRGEKRREKKVERASLQ